MSFIKHRFYISLAGFCGSFAYCFPSDIEFLFFNFQMYLGSSVLFSCFLWLNDLTWLLYLSLYLVPIIPIYISYSFSDDGVAFCIMQLERQFPSCRHLDGCLQLHVFVAVLMFLFLFIIVVLWTLMICCIFPVSQ